MINLELPNQLVGLKQLMNAIAKDMVRPISRKYDRQEHDVPVELAALDRRKGRQAAREAAFQVSSRMACSSMAMSATMNATD